MNGNEFLKKLRKCAKKQGLDKPFYDPTQGKGSHGRVYLGDRETTLKDPKKEISKALLNAMLDDLGIDHNRFS